MLLHQCFQVSNFDGQRLILPHLTLQGAKLLAIFGKFLAVGLQQLFLLDGMQGELLNFLQQAGLRWSGKTGEN